MKVLTQSGLIGKVAEPKDGSIAIVKVGETKIMAYRRGNSAPGSMNPEYRWWKSDSPPDYSIGHSTSNAVPWVEVLRSGDLLVVFYP
jgi:hypothetical protein